MKTKKSGKKLMAAIALGILTLSGFAVNALAFDNRDLNNQSSGAIKGIRNNPFEFIKSEKLSLPANFDYIEQLNKEFSDRLGSDESTSYASGDSLKSLEEESKEK